VEADQPPVVILDGSRVSEERVPVYPGLATLAARRAGQQPMQRLGYSEHVALLWFWLIGAASEPRPNDW
jgi:hypothetical protein